MTFYIGVDPGLVTGVFIYDTVTKKTWKFAGNFTQVLSKISDFIRVEVHELSKTVVIAMERYTLGTTVRTNQTHALETIGAVKFIAETYKPHTIVVMAGAADAAKPGSRENLIRVGWWTPSDPDQHHNKAAAQVALAMMNRQPQLWYSLLTSQVIGDASDTDDSTKVDVS